MPCGASIWSQGTVKRSDAIVHSDTHIVQEQLSSVPGQKIKNSDVYIIINTNRIYAIDVAKPLYTNVRLSMSAIEHYQT